jgi:hypothetical protein
LEEYVWARHIHKWVQMGFFSPVLLKLWAVPLMDRVSAPGEKEELLLLD